MTRAGIEPSDTCLKGMCLIHLTNGPFLKGKWRASIPHGLFAHWIHSPACLPIPPHLPYTKKRLPYNRVASLYMYNRFTCLRTDAIPIFCRFIFIMLIMPILHIKGNTCMIHALNNLILFSNFTVKLFVSHCHVPLSLIGLIVNFCF